MLELTKSIVLQPLKRVGLYRRQLDSLHRLHDPTMGVMALVNLLAYLVWTSVPVSFFYNLRYILTNISSP